MRRRLTASNGPPPLKAEVVAVLLAGWAAPEPPEASDPGFDGGLFELLERGGIARLWVEHESYLRAVAARWGWAPDTVTAHGVRFFGEAAALGEVRER